LSPKNPRPGHLVPTKPMIHRQPAHTLVENQVPESKSAMGWFDPENSKRTVCLDHGPRNGIRLRRSVNFNAVPVTDGDGGVSARFEVHFASGYGEADWIRSMSEGLNREVTHRPGFRPPTVGGVLDGGASCGGGHWWRRRTDEAHWRPRPLSGDRIEARSWGWSAGALTADRPFWSCEHSGPITTCRCSL
jgi:hypothetical protein